MTLNRRQVLAGALGTLGALGASFTPAGAARRSLAEIAASKGLQFGASFSVNELDQPYGEAYAGAYARECRIITSELEFKMHTLRPSADMLDFAPADRLMQFAERHRMAVRGHTLIWNDALPDWFRRLGPDEVKFLLETHIASVMERYKGRVTHWDVVNEPIGPWDRLPGNLRTGVFLDAMGEDYIARSFRIARRIDPAAKLVLNEAQTESDDENGATFRDSLMALVKRLLSDGVPIDAIGLQSHLDSRRPYDFPRFAGFLEELAALGLEIHLTELDVNDLAFPAGARVRDARVAALYKGFLDAALKVKAVKTVITWQLADHTSWLYGMAREKGLKRKPRPLPLDSQFRPKASWSAMAEAFEGAPVR